MRRGDGLLEARAAAGDDEIRIGRVGEGGERQAKKQTNRFSHAARLRAERIAAVSARITAVTWAPAADIGAQRAARTLVP